MTINIYSGNKFANDSYFAAIKVFELKTAITRLVSNYR